MFHVWGVCVVLLRKSGLEFKFLCWPVCPASPSFLGANRSDFRFHLCWFLWVLARFFRDVRYLDVPFFFFAEGGWGGLQLPIFVGDDFERYRFLPFFNFLSSSLLFIFPGRDGLCSCSFFFFPTFWGGASFPILYFRNVLEVVFLRQPQASWRLRWKEVFTFPDHLGPSLCFYLVLFLMILPAQLVCLFLGSIFRTFSDSLGVNFRSNAPAVCWAISEVFCSQLRLSSAGSQRRLYWGLIRTLLRLMRKEWPLLAAPELPCRGVVAYIYILDTYRRNDNRRMINDRRTNKGRRKTSLTTYLPLYFIARVQKGCSRFACERVLETEHKLHILTPLLWPSRCVFLVLLMLG